MISALAAGVALSAMLAAVLRAAQPKPKRVPVRVRATRQAPLPHD